jgi:hypothetical protein
MIIHIPSFVGPIRRCEIKLRLFPLTNTSIRFAFVLVLRMHTDAVPIFRVAISVASLLRILRKKGATIAAPG